MLTQGSDLTFDSHTVIFGNQNFNLLNFFILTKYFEIFLNICLLLLFKFKKVRIYLIDSLYYC